MSLPTSFNEMVNRYAAEGDRDGLLQVRSHVTEFMNTVANARHTPESLDRSKTIEMILEMVQDQIAYIDQTLRRMPI
jgi:hypothetical protein